MEGSGVDEGGGLEKLLRAPPARGSPPALPTQVLVQPRPEGEVGGQGKGGEKQIESC